MLLKNLVILREENKRMLLKHTFCPCVLKSWIKSRLLEYWIDQDRVYIFVLFPLKKKIPLLGALPWLVCWQIYENGKWLRWDVTQLKQQQKPSHRRNHSTPHAKSRHCSVPRSRASLGTVLPHHSTHIQAAHWLAVCLLAKPLANKLVSAWGYPQRLGRLISPGSLLATINEKLISWPCYGKRESVPSTILHTEWRYLKKYISVLEK